MRLTIARVYRSENVGIALSMEVAIAQVAATASG